MKLTLCLFSALVLSAAACTAQAQTATKKFFQRIPAQVSCPGGGCSTNAGLIRPGTGTGSVVTPPTGGSGGGSGTVPGSTTPVGGGTTPGSTAPETTTPGGTTPGVPNETLGGLWISAYNVYFDSVAINVGSQTKSVLVVNQSNATISVGLKFSQPSGLNFHVTSDCGKSIAAGASCTFDFTFEPYEAGYFVAYQSLQTVQGDFNIELSGHAVLKLDQPVSTSPGGGGDAI